MRAVHSYVLWTTAALAAFATATIYFVSHSSDPLTSLREDGDLGIDFGQIAEREHLATFPKSQYVITSMLYVTKRRQVWLGTTDGITICTDDGKVVRRVASVSGHPGKERDDEADIRFAAPTRSDLHSTIVGIRRVTDGTFWARGISGSYHLKEDGEVLGDYVDEVETIKAEYDAICREAGLHEWFPVLDNTAYVPWSAAKAARYNGKTWLVEPGAPPLTAGPIKLWDNGRVYIICGKPCVAGFGGVFDLPGRRWVIRAQSAAVAQIGGTTTCIGAGQVYVVSEGGAAKVGALAAEGLTATSRGEGAVALSDYDSSEVGLLDRRDGGGWDFQRIQLPQGHRWRSFVSVDGISGPGHARGSSMVVSTSRGLVRIERGRSEVLLDIATPPLRAPWDALVAYGVHVNCCVEVNGQWLVGTGIGLGRFTPRTGQFEWLWRVG